MGKIVRRSKDLEEVVEKLINEKSSLKDLKDLNVRVLVFVCDGMKEFAKIRVVPEYWRIIIGELVGEESKENVSMFAYIIEINREWVEKEIGAYLEAVLFHELCHCSVSRKGNSGKIVFGIKDHEVEEFFEVVRDYGEYDVNIRMMGDEIIKLRGIKLRDNSKEKNGGN